MRNDDTWDNPWQGTDSCWYWYDETGDEHGPYASLRAATEELRAYEHFLNHGPAIVTEEDYRARMKENWAEIRRNLWYAAWIVAMGALGYVLSVYFSRLPH